MKAKTSYVSILWALPVVAAAATAEAAGDPGAGLAYAGQACSECHAVQRGVRMSPHRRAPAFQVIADSGMREDALRVWFQSPHPSMPDLSLTEQSAEDLIAYILSLRRRG